MKQVNFRKLDIRNFKATTSVAYEIGPGGIMVAGYNGSGKSTIIEAILFALGASVEAGKVLNQATKAPATVSLTIEADGKASVYTRTLTPTTDATGKVTSSTSTYTIDDNPQKAGEYSTRVAQLFGCRDWQYLINPALLPGLKESRAYLLEVAGAPAEREYLSRSNPSLGEIIGATHFADFEKQEKAKVEAIGKKIAAIPARIEELSAMIEPVEEIDLTGVSERIESINAELKGIDQGNASKADEFNRVANEARKMQYQAAKLRAKAAEVVAGANKQANKEIEESEKVYFEWRQTLNRCLREQDRIKAEMSEARTDLARAEARAQELYAEAHKHAEAHKQTSLRPIDSEKLGQCAVCNKWCGDLAARGAEAAEKQRTNELARIVEAGKQVMSLRDKELAKINEITDRIDGLMSKEHKVEARINALSPAPKAPERTVITETPESLHLIGQAQDLESTAEKLIKENRLDIMQKPTELVEELQQLNEKLTRRGIATTTQKNNDKITARIEELRREESALITTQLQHKQHLAMLAQFHKEYANEVTGKCNDIFRNTEYSVILFSENMGNERGSVVFQPCKNGSTNLSHSENTMFWKLFVERVLGPHFGLACCPMILDDVEHIDTTEKLRSNHQVIAARVERHELTIENI